MKSYTIFLSALVISGSFLVSGCENKRPSEASPNDAEIVSRDADTVFTNVPGTAHPGIDAYAEADEAGSLFRVMSEAGSFKSFSEAVYKAGLTEALNDDEAYTVFAPTDEAFAKIPQETLNELYKPENKQKLIDLVNSHIVRGNIDRDDLSDGSTLTTLNGNTIDVKMVDGSPTVNNKPIIVQDENPENGALYALDEVLIPAGN